MGKIRKGIAGWGRLLAYPLLRPAQDIRESAQSLREAARTAKAQRQQRAETGQEVSKLLAGHTAEEKFQAAYEAWGWDEKLLANQLVAARRTRIAALGTGILGFLGVIVLMLFLHGWILLMLAAVALVLAVGGVLQGVRFAWWEFEIETRSITPLRVFISRPDLMGRLFSLRSGK